MHAGIYIRVSTTQQAEEGTSLETQEAACRARAEANGDKPHETVVWREEWSGADLDRPQLNLLRSAIHRGEISRLYVYSTDRLSRDTLHLLTLHAECKENGVQLIFVDGPSGDTPDGKMLLVVLGLLGERERALISERTQRGKREAARSGRMPVGTGKGLYGYRYNRDTRKREVDEAEAAQVRRVYQWVLERLSDYAIACRLNDDGIPTKSGCKWHPLTVKRMRSNRAYTGLQYYEQTMSRKAGSKRETTIRPADEWIAIDGWTPQIISPELYELVQRVSATRSGRRNPVSQPYLMSGRTWCADCGSRVVGASQGGQRKRYRYYRCTATTPTSTGPAACSARYIPADVFENAAWEHFVSLVSCPGVLEPDMPEMEAPPESATKEEVARLRREIAEHRAEQRNLIELRQKSFVDLDLLEAQLRPLKALSDEKSRRLSLLEAQLIPPIDADEPRHDVEGFGQRLARRMMEMDFDEKRAALNAFEVRATVRREVLLLEIHVDAMAKLRCAAVPRS